MSPTFTATVTDAEGHASSASAQFVVAPVTPAFPAGWGTPLFLDYFDGTGLDTSKWTALDQVGHANEISWLQAKNATVSGGLCHLTARQESNPGGRAWTSAYISTQGKFQTPLDRAWRLEYRAKQPHVDGKSQGMWSAGWVRNSPSSGEIDISEVQGNGPTNIHPISANNNSSTFWENTSGGAGIRKIGKDTSPLAWGQFHTHALEGDPTTGAYRVLVDEVVTQSVTPVSDSWVGSVHSPASWLKGGTFASSWYLIFNLQVGGYYGNPDPTTLPVQDYQLDYVRGFTR